MNSRQIMISLGAAAVAAGLGGFGLSSTAVAQGHHDSPLAKVESRRYPVGSSIREEFKTPSATVSFAAAEGGPSILGMDAAASAAGAQRIGARVVGAQLNTQRFQLSPIYSTRIGVAGESALIQGGVAAAAAHVDDAALLAAEQEGVEQAKYVVAYELLHKGIPLAKPTSSTALIGADGKVLFVRERNLPKNGEIPVDATVAADEAVAVGRTDVGNHADLQTSKPALEIWVDGGQNAHLTWAYTVSSPPKVDAVARKYWIAARGEVKILHSEDLIYSANEPQVPAARQDDPAKSEEYATPFPPIPLPIFSGKVTGTIWPPLKSPTSMPAGQPGFPLPFMTIRRNGLAVATTTGSGTFAFAGLGSANLSANLSGLFCVVDNKAGSVLVRSKSASAGMPVKLDFNASGEQELAQVSVYYWANAARQFASSVLVHLPPGPGRLDKLPARVNINQTCNAFWDGSAINFFKSGGCPNTAFGDVVLHEYGHGIDASLGGILDGALSEGFGDSVSILVLHDPIIGRDFFGPGQNLRDARNIVTWPPSNPEVHFAGQIYAGFTWELTRRLISKFGNEDKAFAVAKDLTLGAAALNPMNIPDAIALMFKVDDNDNNPNNGTPHAAEIKAAAASRHIPVPAPF